MSKEEEIKELLTRGVTNVIEKPHLEKALKIGKKLRVKFGIDPTGPKVHIGHAITFWKLRKFQELGHKVVLIIGDFTAQIGDPSDKMAERQPLTEKEVKENLKGYMEQIGKVVNLKKAELQYNSSWHKKGSKADLINEAMNFTVNQMIQRENFSERFKNDKPIGLQEFLYPLLQGMDSVQVKANVELGGNDQYFNLLAGRTLQKRYEQEPQDIMTFELLLGPDGQKMSKTYNNAIWLDDSADDMYGKVMSIKDELIIPYFYLAAINVSVTEIKTIEKELKQGKNPRDAKAKLAFEIVNMYHGQKIAEKTQKEFDRIFRDKGKHGAEIKYVPNQKLVDVLIAANLISSKNEYRRLAEQGGIRIDGNPIGDGRAPIEIYKGMYVEVGKRKALTIK